ncbi:hypothetical protein HG717_15970 [Rhodococcus erythropolis]|uniref:hypothetical protein n=1 Tax=Rhodococcus erythropolis TaxID=1833 RepID=UPI001C9BAEA8|nr:hypothetical protein [Rhodococcus erythropolis]MBY6385397.1 hypothetical protein [Rhodococcus erythropolis]
MRISAQRLWTRTLPESVDAAQPINRESYISHQPNLLIQLLVAFRSCTFQMIRRY